MSKDDLVSGAANESIGVEASDAQVADGAGSALALDEGISALPAALMAGGGAEVNLSVGGGDSVVPSLPHSTAGTAADAPAPAPAMPAASSPPQWQALGRVYDDPGNTYLAIELTQLDVDGRGFQPSTSSDLQQWLVQWARSTSGDSEWSAPARWVRKGNGRIGPHVSIAAAKPKPHGQ
jgi:hypothetical protein